MNFNSGGRVVAGSNPVIPTKLSAKPSIERSEALLFFDRRACTRRFGETTKIRLRMELCAIPLAHSRQASSPPLQKGGFRGIGNTRDREACPPYPSPFAKGVCKDACWEVGSRDWLLRRPAVCSVYAFPFAAAGILANEAKGTRRLLRSDFFASMQVARTSSAHP